MERDKENRKKVTRLVVKAGKGDRKAFEKLIQEKSLSILYNAHEVLKDYHEAQDAAQEAVMLMYKKIGQLKDPQYFDAWLYKLVRNVCMGMLRTKYKKNESVEDSDFFSELEESDEDTLPKEYLDNVDKKESLIHAINELPKRSRETLYLYYFEEMTYNEIAYALDISTNTVGTNLVRGKQELKKILEKGSENGLQATQVVSAAPLLQEAFKTNAEKIISPDMINLFEKACHKALTVLKVSTKASSNVFSIGSLKMITAVVISATIITGGITTVNEYIIKDQSRKSSVVAQKNIKSQTQRSSAEKHEGEIVFDQGDCDCGHVNPKKIYVKGISYNHKASWEIKSYDGRKVSTGTGDSISDESQKLIEGKLDGKYTAIFEITYDDGYSFIQKRDFTIDNNNIEPGQYK